jgi:hypothetical protein
MLTGQSGFLTRPETFQNQLVYMDNDSSLGRLYRFDGSHATLAYGELVRDFHMSGDRLYVLTNAGLVLETSDLVDWTLLGSAPVTARSLAVIGGQLFVGTNDASIFRATFLDVTPVPEPSVLALVAPAFGVATLVFRLRRNRLVSLGRQLSAT